jgi:hypothetical protein
MQDELIAGHVAVLLGKGSGYKRVRTLEDGSLRELQAQQQPQSQPQDGTTSTTGAAPAVAKQRAARRTPQMLQEAWERHERAGLHQCANCGTVMTSKPTEAHDRKCQSKKQKAS